MKQLIILLLAVLLSVALQAQSNSINRYDGMSTEEIKEPYTKFVIDDLRTTKLIKINKFIMVSSIGTFLTGLVLYKTMPEGRIVGRHEGENGEAEYHRKFSAGQTTGYVLMIASVMSFTYTIPFTVGAHFTRKKARKNIELIKNRR